MFGESAPDTAFSFRAAGSDFISDPSAVSECFNQDQHLDFVDFKNLNERLKANSIQEKLTNMWLDRAFGRNDFKRLYGQAT